jgi:hypothetical protein
MNTVSNVEIRTQLRMKVHAFVWTLPSLRGGRKTEV